MKRTNYRQKHVKWNHLIKSKTKVIRENTRGKKKENIKRLKCGQCAESLYFRANYTEEKRQNQHFLKNKSMQSGNR